MMGLWTTGLGYCRRLNYSRNIVAAGQKYFKINLPSWFASSHLEVFLESLIALPPRLSTPCLSFSQPEKEGGERHSLRQALSAATLLSRSSWALASPPSCLTSSLAVWTLAVCDPQLLSLYSFEELGCCWQLTYKCLWYLLLLLEVVLHSMTSSAPPVPACPMCAQLCCLVTAAWTNQNFTWKIALTFIPLPRQRQWQGRHQSCKSIATLLILPGNHRGEANLSVCGYSILHGKIPACPA